MISVHDLAKGHFSDGYQILNRGFENIPDLVTKHVWSHNIWAGGYREENFFVASHYCVLDFDDGLTVTQAILRFSKYRCFIGSTKSHQVSKTTKKGQVLKPCDRFRVIIPWETPIYNMDLAKYNMKLRVKEFESDPYAADTARCWQPCKELLILTSQGEHLPVITDIPKEETTAYKQKQYTSQRKYFRETRSVPSMVLDMLKGRFVPGDINLKLFVTGCHLMEEGHSMYEVVDMLEEVPGLSDHAEFYSTLKSAAKHVGAV